MRQAGFTLLELLVAMALMALLAVGLGSGIHLGTRVWERAEVGRGEWSERQTTRLLLQRTLQRLIPQSLSQEPTDATALFLGGRRALRFVGPAPGESAPPGLYRMEFALVPGDSGLEFVFRWQPHTGEPLGAPFIAAGQRVLLSAIDGAALSYFGTREEGWLAAWNGRVDLPQLVRLEYRPAAERDPDGEPQMMLIGTYLGVPEP
jgi:general secretion pathway protein J